jgi:hypothetical protein
VRASPTFSLRGQGGGEKDQGEQERRGASRVLQNFLSHFISLGHGRYF